MKSAEIALRFLVFSVHSLRDNYLPKIIETVELLTEAELWSKPADAANSIGNLLLHLEGNVRQHIISGAGGLFDVRNRPREFAEKGGISKEILINNLEVAVKEACDVLEALEHQILLETREIQNKTVVLMDDIFHVVEHFAYHSGQIIFAVKALKRRGFDWYKYLDKT